MTLTMEYCPKTVLQLEIDLLPTMSVVDILANV